MSHYLGKFILFVLVVLELTAEARIYTRFDLNVVMTSSFSKTAPESKLISRSLLQSGISDRILNALDYQLEASMDPYDGLGVSKAKLSYAISRRTSFSLGVDYVPAAGFSENKLSKGLVQTSIYFRKFKPYPTYAPGVMFENRSMGNLKLIVLKDVNNIESEDEFDYGQLLQSKYFADDGVEVPAFVVDWQIQYGKFFPNIQFSSYDRNNSRYIAASLDVYISAMSLNLRLVNDARYTEGISEGLPNIVRILERGLTLSYSLGLGNKITIDATTFSLDAPDSLRSSLNLEAANHSNNVFWDDLSENGEMFSLRFEDQLSNRLQYYFGGRQMVAKYFIDESHEDTEKRFASEYFIGLSGAYF